MSHLTDLYRNALHRDPVATAPVSTPKSVSADRSASLGKFLTSDGSLCEGQPLWAFSFFGVAAQRFFQQCDSVISQPLMSGIFLVFSVPYDVDIEGPEVKRRFENAKIIFASELANDI